ncbi:Glycosyltransferase involved in cell wall bisynthesis [Marinobacter antarcticus]|uniref:Glycosyltransferase involved in cell wall bisynthesis n=1 Tax=Marinobacter antarcticus TaxID=564117 RepID=A0A1M6SMM8_9GAMM|nr:glycosyltransferase family 2 protein [Marinobacter antarcticus]SHK46034.1 Glycosyltransferase involved in cell wall bisynthesis [Marinobacter antarcticus]
MKDSISVAIPVFNRADWITKTLDQIFSQSIPVDEVVLCDDGSTDNLEQAIKHYKNRIKVIRIENSGPGIARKTAIESSHGDWIALCDSDDFWYPNHIENFSNALVKFPETNFYFSNFVTSDHPDKTKFELAPDGWMKRLTGEPCSETSRYHQCTPPFLKSLLEFQACFPSCTVFSRNLYQASGGITDRVSRWASEDLHLTARMAAVSNAVIGTEQTVLINKHEGNFSAEYIRNLEGELLVLRDLVEHRLVPDSLANILEEQLNYYPVRLFRSYYWASENKKAIEIAKDIPAYNLIIRDRIRLLIALIRGELEP